MDAHPHADAQRTALSSHVLREILCLLPLEALFKLRSVRKEWRSLPFSLLFLEPPPSAADNIWIFVFRLLAHKVNLREVVTYKCTSQTWNVDYSRTFGGCSSFSGAQLLAQTPLLQHLHSGALDILASMPGGLVLWSLWLTVQTGDKPKQERKQTLALYNPLTKCIRILPRMQWEPQKVAAAVDENGNYKIYALSKHLRPGTEYRLFSFETFDPLRDSWEAVSHVSANLSLDGELHGNKPTIMGYVCSKATCSLNGFFYWMSTLDYREEQGLQNQLYACDMAKGYFYRLPGVPRETSFVSSMWPTRTGVQLICGVAPQHLPPHQLIPREGGGQLDMNCMQSLFGFGFHVPARPVVQTHEQSCEGGWSLSSGVEVWELHQGTEDQEVGDDKYGAREPPQGTQWKMVCRLPVELWKSLTHVEDDGVGRKVSCVVAASADISGTRVFLYAEGEEQHMMVFEPGLKSWTLRQAVPFKLFLERDADCDKVLPWSCSVNPGRNATV